MGAAPLLPDSPHRSPAGASPEFERGLCPRDRSWGRFRKGGEAPLRVSYLRPPASFVASGSLRNRPMATTPSAGPNARAANAHDHPAPRTSGGTSQIDAIVSANPTHVCVVRAVPTYAGGESSVIAVENWAESAMIVIPQTLASASVTSGGPPSVNQIGRASCRERGSVWGGGGASTGEVGT